MILRYTERAQIDIDIAIGWYEKQRKGLGMDFLACVNAVSRHILGNPSLYPLKYKTFRCAVIRRFPFTVFYTVGENEIIVHAVFDNRQDPAKRP